MVRELILDCLATKPRKRPSAVEIVDRLRAMPDLTPPPSAAAAACPAQRSAVLPTPAGRWVSGSRPARASQAGGPAGGAVPPLGPTPQGGRLPFESDASADAAAIAVAAEATVAQLEGSPAYASPVPGSTAALAAAYLAAAVRGRAGLPPRRAGSMLPGTPPGAQDLPLVQPPPWAPQVVRASSSPPEHSFIDVPLSPTRAAAVLRGSQPAWPLGHQASLDDPVRQLAGGLVSVFSWWTRVGWDGRVPALVGPLCSCNTGRGALHETLRSRAPHSPPSAHPCNPTAAPLYPVPAELQRTIQQLAEQAPAQHFSHASRQQQLQPEAAEAPPLSPRAPPLSPTSAATAARCPLAHQLADMTRSLRQLSEQLSTGSQSSSFAGSHQLHQHAPAPVLPPAAEQPPAPHEEAAPARQPPQGLPRDVQGRPRPSACAYTTSSSLEQLSERHEGETRTLAERHLSQQAQLSDRQHRQRRDLAADQHAEEQQLETQQEGERGRESLDSLSAELQALGENDSLTRRLLGLHPGKQHAEVEGAARQPSLLLAASLSAGSPPASSFARVSAYLQSSANRAATSPVYSSPFAQAAAQEQQQEQQPPSQLQQEQQQQEEQEQAQAVGSPTASPFSLVSAYLQSSTELASASPSSVSPFAQGAAAGLPPAESPPRAVP